MTAVVDDGAGWRARWAEGRIGFHEGAANRFLVEHLGVFAGRRRVLVPLCGKAEDLAYLAGAGLEVVGVELVEEAVRAFFAEHAMDPTVSRDGELVRYQAGSVTIFAGDVFATTAAITGPIDALYDRAALVALPAELRARYAAHLRGLVTPGARELLVTFEYPQDRMQGPPFSVVESEVRSLYAGCDIELCASRATTLRDPTIPAVERCFAITVR